MTKYYCPMPWHGGYFTTSRQSVCCSHRGQPGVALRSNGDSPLAYINSEHVRDIKRRLISGNLDIDCSSCRDKEQQGLGSLREVFQTMIGNLGVEFCEDPDSPTVPAAIEVRFSNLCNFQCRMCGPRDSNLIGKEIEMNPNMQRFFELYQDGLITASDRFFDEIVQMLPNLKRIYFTGGEPMIHKQVLELIKIIIDLNLNDRLELAMTTNGSAINPYIIDQLKKFRRVQLTVSVDGVGKIGEYQRHKSDWPKIKENIEILGNMSWHSQQQTGISINSVISAYTVLDIDSLMEYYIELYQRYRCAIGITIIGNYHYLSPEALPAHLRPAAQSRLRNAIKILQPFSQEHFVVKIIEQLKQLDNLLSTSPVDREFYKQFVEFTRMLDKARNQDFEKTFGLPLEID